MAWRFFTAGGVAKTGEYVELAANAVTSAKILDGTIVNADISASAGITNAKLATPGWAKLGTFTINANSLTYTSIPQTYTHLRVHWVAQSNRAGFANTGGRFRINGFTTYYDTYYTVPVATGTEVGASFGYVGQIPAGNRTSDNYVSIVTIDLPLYLKANQLRGWAADNSGHDGTNILSGRTTGTNRASPNAISSITLLDDVGGTLGTRSYAELWAV